MLIQDFQSKLTAYGRRFEKLPLNQHMTITFDLSNAIAGYGDIHLDAILQSIVVGQAITEQLPPNPHGYDIPLPLQVAWSSDNRKLYNTSNLQPKMYYDGLTPARGIFYWVKNTGDARHLDLAERKKDNTVWSPDETAGVYKAYRVPLPTLATDSLVATCCGNVEAVTELLQIFLDTNGTIGKKRSIGFGQVVNFSVEPLDIDSPNFYHFITNSYLTRPVPIQALKSLGFTCADMNAVAPVQEAFTPPYWLAHNQLICYPKDTELTDCEKTNLIGYTSVRSLSEFVYQVALASKQPEIETVHPKFQMHKGIGELDALTGYPINAADGGAVALKDGISTSMGNVVDFLKVPTSNWLSLSSAVLLGYPKVWHRNMLALNNSKTGEKRLIWPTLAVDPKTPNQARPLWREVIINLAELATTPDWEIVAVFTSDPKVRLWPRAKISRLGTQTAFYVFDGDLAISALLELNITELKKQMLFVESLLDMGFGRNAIKSDLFANLATANKIGLSQTRDLENQLQHLLRSTLEFPVAWRVARDEESRKLRNLQPKKEDICL